MNGQCASEADDCKVVSPPLTVRMKPVLKGTTGCKLKLKEVAPDSL